MTKFRKWLIHKLGGFTELSKPELKQEEMRLVTVKAKIDLYDVSRWSKEYREWFLKVKIAEQLQPLFYRNAPSLDDPLEPTTFTAEIKVPSIYVNEEE